MFAALLRAAQNDRHMDAVAAIEGFNLNKLRWVLTAAVLCGELTEEGEIDWPNWQSHDYGATA